MTKSDLVGRLVKRIPITSTPSPWNDLEMVSSGYGQYANGYRLTQHAMRRIINAIADELEADPDIYNRRDCVEWLRREASE